ncbi:hypothetical protein Q8A73_009568 [Channa argus]|nr:hypothetical protein Q8A73_009568 [Channa argus]
MISITHSVKAHRQKKASVARKVRERPDPWRGEVNEGDGAEASTGSGEKADTRLTSTSDTSTSVCRTSTRPESEHEWPASSDGRQQSNQSKLRKAKILNFSRGSMSLCVALQASPSQLQSDTDFTRGCSGKEETSKGRFSGP